MWIHDSFYLQYVYTGCFKEKQILYIPGLVQKFFMVFGLYRHLLTGDLSLICSLGLPVGVCVSTVYPFSSSFYNLHWNPFFFITSVRCYLLILYFCSVFSLYFLAIAPSAVIKPSILIQTLNSFWFIFRYFSLSFSHFLQMSLCWSSFIFVHLLHLSSLCTSCIFLPLFYGLREGIIKHRCPDNAFVIK